jgi:cation transport ATPase-like protein
MQTPDVTGAATPTTAETLAKLGGDDQKGLTDVEVQARLKKYGQTRWWKNRKTRSPRCSHIFGGRFRG